MTLDDLHDTYIARDGSVRRYHSARETRYLTMTRQSKLRALGKCINGPLVGNVGRKGVEHGIVVAGGRCQRCIDAKRRSH